MILFEFFKTKPKITETILKENIDEDIHIFGNNSNISNLQKMTNLKRLYITNIKTHDFEKLCRLNLNLEMLYINNFHIENLSSLENFKSIQYFLFDWNNKNKSLMNFENFKNLKGLYINDFKRLNSIKNISNIKTLKYFLLSGGIWNKVSIDNLEPISKLNNLLYLHLSNISVKFDGLTPLSTLINLEELSISNQFETKDYAMLAAKLVNTKCSSFSPYIELGQKIGEHDIMIVGKKKPFLNSIKDKARIEKYEIGFNNLKKGYLK